MNPLKLANPVIAAQVAVGLTGAAVGVAETLARRCVDVVQWGLHRLSLPAGLPVQPRDASAQDQEPQAAEAAGEVWTESPALPFEPHAPEEPPIDVVGEALAAEAAFGDHDVAAGVGFAHEPRASSRDEEHGAVPLQRAEVEGIADEVSAALHGDEDPEEHLTEPVLDEAEAKAIAAEMRTLRRAADPHKH